MQKVHDTVGDTEVDVVAISMGGLVARYAATPGDQDTAPLAIRRLFTLASPHRGARLARYLHPDPRTRDMRAGSGFLARLDEARDECDYELVPYGRLGDWIVGVENAAPPCTSPWWVSNLPFQDAHSDIARDPRLLADIARRLRGERPWTTEPPSPLP